MNSGHSGTTGTGSVVSGRSAQSAGGASTAPAGAVTVPTDPVTKPRDLGDELRSAHVGQVCIHCVPPIPEAFPKASPIACLAASRPRTTDRQRAPRRPLTLCGTAAFTSRLGLVGGPTTVAALVIGAGRDRARRPRRGRTTPLHTRRRRPGPRDRYIQTGEIRLELGDPTCLPMRSDRPDRGTPARAARPRRRTPSPGEPDASTEGGPASQSRWASTMALRPKIRPANGSSPVLTGNTYRS